VHGVLVHYPSYPHVLALYCQKKASPKAIYSVVRLGALSRKQAPRPVWVCNPLPLQAMVDKAVQLLSQDPLLHQRGIAVVAADPGWCR